MAKTTCALAKQGIVKQRGKPSIEWYKDEVPQYYCCGYIDSSTDEPFETCRNCVDWTNNAADDHWKWDSRHLKVTE